MIVADALIAPPDKLVALRYQQESVFGIELGDTREGQLAPIGFKNAAPSALADASSRDSYAPTNSRRRAASGRTA